MQALGLIETRGLIAAVESADAMLKAAEVTILEKTYVGGGLVSIAVTGGVAAVKAAVEAGAAAVKQINGTLLVSQHVIPRPHEELDSLIVPIEPPKNLVVKSIESLGSEYGKETAIENIVSEDSVAEDSILEDSISEESISDGTVSEDIVIKEYPKEKETISLDISLDKINKEIVDKIVLEYNLEKALGILNRLKVTKLRNLAREYENMGITGRMISKADKKILLTEFKKFYRKN